MMAQRCGFELEREFSKSYDPNLQMLFRRVAKGQLEIDPQSCRQTLAALTRALMSGRVRFAVWTIPSPSPGNSGAQVLPV